MLAEGEQTAPSQKVVALSKKAQELRRRLPDLSKSVAKTFKRVSANKFSDSKKHGAVEIGKSVRQYWRNVAGNLKDQEEQLAVQQVKRARQERLEDVVAKIETASESLAALLCLTTSLDSSSQAPAQAFDCKHLSAHVTTPVPNILQYDLRSYQHIGLHWLASLHNAELNGILADEMGLGKTIMTIALMAHLALQKKVWGPHLIIVPTSVQLNWVYEFRKWVPGFSVLAYYGSATERAEKRQGGWGDDKHNVVIASYSVALADEYIFKRKQWYYMVLDEAQNIKNSKSKKWQSLVDFKTKRRLMLTGTPLQNDLMELWSLLSFLMPGMFGTSIDFKAWFADPMNKAVTSKQVDHALVRRLHNVLRPFMLRRLKSEVELELPAKYEYVRHCRMSGQQKKLYNEFLDRRDVQKTLRSSNYLRVLNICMQLRKVCNHPELFHPRLAETPFTMEPIDLVIPGRIFMALYDTVGKGSPGCLPGDCSFSTYLTLRRPRVLLEPLSSCTSNATLASVAASLVCKFQRIRCLRPAGLPSPSVDGPCSSVVTSAAGNPGSHAAALTKRCWIAGHWITSKWPQRNVQQPLVSLQVSQRLRQMMTRVLSSQVGKRVEKELHTIGAAVRDCSERMDRLEKMAKAVESQRRFVQRDVERLDKLIREGDKTVYIDDEYSSPHPKRRRRQRWVNLVDPNLPVAGGHRGAAFTPAAFPAGEICLCSDDEREGAPDVPVVARSRYRDLFRRQPQPVSSRPVARNASSLQLLFQPAAAENFGGGSSGSRSRALFQPVARDRASATVGTIYWNMADGISLGSVDGLSQLALARDVFSSFSETSFHRLHTEVRLTTALQRLEAKIRNLGCMNMFVFRVPKAQVLTSRPHCLVRGIDDLPMPAEEALTARAELHPHGQGAARGVHGRSNRGEDCYWHARWLHAQREQREQLQLLREAASSRAWGCSSGEAAHRYISRWAYSLMGPLACRLPDKRFLEHDCGKLQELTSMLKEFKLKGSKCIIFTQFALMLNILEEFASYHNFRYVRLDGHVKVEMRQSLVDRFNGDKDMFLFLASTRAGGVGINLTAANVVIFYDSDWNPAIDRQATDRAHRIGQTREVHIYRMITERSVEENIWKRQLEKRMLDDLVIDQGSFTPESMRAIAQNQQAWDLNTVRSLVTGKDIAPESSPLTAVTGSETESVESSEISNVKADRSWQQVLNDVEDVEDQEAAKELLQLAAEEAEVDRAENDPELEDLPIPTSSPSSSIAVDNAESEATGDIQRQPGTRGRPAGDLHSFCAHRMALDQVAKPKGPVAAKRKAIPEAKWSAAQLVPLPGMSSGTL